MMIRVLQFVFRIPQDLFLEIVSIDYVNLLGYFLFYFSTGLTVCYSFRLFYYTLCRDFNLTTF